MRWSNMLILLVLSLLVAPPLAFAQALQRIEIPSSFNPVGSGAQALGMGGAFIAVADDATAASWNPGGLYQLYRPEASFVGSMISREEENRFNTNPEANGREVINIPAVNYLSAVYPLPHIKGRRLILSANYQRLYDMNRSWYFPLQQSEGDLNLTQNVDYRQTGALTALGISVGTQLTKNKPKRLMNQKFRVGLIGIGGTLNFWDAGFNENQWEQKTRQNGSGTVGANPFEFTTLSRDRFTLKGINYNLGIHWQSPDNHISAGLIYKSALRADLVHNSRFESEVEFPDQPSANTSSAPPPITTNEKLEFPSTIGFGMTWRPGGDATTMVSLDIYRIDWGDFVLEDEDGYRTSPINGKPISKADIDPVYPVRIGFRHDFRYRGESSPADHIIPLRLGALYDPAPAEGEPDAFYGVSLGSGIEIIGHTNHFALDFAYLLRFASDAGTSILQNLEFEQDVTEHTFYTSLIVYFGKQR